MDSRSNALARFRLLTKALSGEKNVPASLAKACRSQGGLARYECIGQGIEPMALNTLKASAERFIENGGWSMLDEMRKRYLAACKKGGKSPSPHSRHAEQRSTLAELEQALDVERRYRIRLQVAYEALLARLRSQAKSDAELAHFINRHVVGFSIKRLTVAGANGAAGR